MKRCERHECDKCLANGEAAALFLLVALASVGGSVGLLFGGAWGMLAAGVAFLLAVLKS